jgi:hypothetical protein
MSLLRRVLVLQATVWAVFGVAIAVAPAALLDAAFGLAARSDDTFVRVSGILAFSLALLMVLVARRLDDLWWWSWAFVIAAGGSALVSGAHALLGVPAGSPVAGWWAFAAVSAAFAIGLIAGLARAGVDRPVT